MSPAEASMVMPATADAVFAILTDIGRLPEWNQRMTSVIEEPAALEIDAQWVVEFRALGQTWRSRSTVEEFDVAARRFAYRSMTDDGNPSYAQWTWTVAETSSARVTVAWTLHPATFWRRVLLVRIRARQLARTELPASLAALASLVASERGVEQADTKLA